MTNWSASGVTCDVYIDNMTSAVREAELKAAAYRRQIFTDAEPAFFLFLSNVAEPAVCLFGIAGNILNLIVLTRKQLQRLVILLIKSRTQIITESSAKGALNTGDIQIIGLPN